MYDLRTLGTLDLRGPDGASLGPVLAQPKRAALLAYLALSRPHGPVRRDLLLATFWPELPDARARAALRNALSFLRREAPGILAARADDAVELAEGALSCDARRMEAALAAGDVAGALAHYGGDLLAGVHVEGAPAWEHWRDAERLRLRRAALASARAAAEAARRRGDAGDAVALARRACAIDPEDEPSLRGLMEALAAAGDPAGAVREYERFAAGLMRELELAPAPETEALRRALATRPDRPPIRAPVPPASASHGASGDADHPAGRWEDSARPAANREDAHHPPAAPSVLREPEESAKHEGRAADEASASLPPPIVLPPALDASDAGDAAEVQSPRGEVDARRRPARGGWIAAVVGVIALVAAMLVIPRMRGGEDDGVDTRIAVLPFAVRAGPAHAYLGEGMADLLSVRLDGTGALTTVDPFALLFFLRAGGLRDATGMEAGQAAAARFDAGRFVLGTVVEAGGRLHLSAALYAADGRRLARAEAAEVREDSLFAAVDALVRTLAAQGMRTPPEQLDRMAALTTGSLPSLKAYLAGERAFRAGDFGAAADAFAEAVAGDSGFALASYRLSVAQDWAARDGSAAADRALRFATRLPAAEQRLLRARVAFRTGDAAVAETLLREVVQSRPDHVEAWNDLGEVIHHRAMWQGRSITAARAAWQQVVGLDPSNVNARVHLSHLAALEERPEEVDHLVREIQALSPAHEGLDRLRTLRAFALRDAGAEAEMVAALRARRPRDAGDLPAWGAAWRTADFLVDPEAGLRIAAPLVEADRGAQSRLAGFAARAHMQMARGRWRDARAQADSAARIDPGYAARTWAFLVAFHPSTLPRAEVVRAYGRLAASSLPMAEGIPGPVDEERGRYPAARREYLLGALAVRMGDAVEARRRIDGLAALRDTTAQGRFAAHLWHQLRARRLAASGDAAGALRLVEAGWPRPVPELFVKDDSYSTVAERFFRARLLAGTGRDAEALAWYGSLTEDISRGIVFPVAAELERGRALERMGRRREAARHFARFADRWRDADPEAAADLAYARSRAR